MESEIIVPADEISLFCRLQMKIKRNIPIRPSEMGVLIFAQKQSYPVTPIMVSNFFHISKPSVTSMINTLVKKEYLMKTPSATDGRSYIVSITNKGKELVKSTYIEYFKSMEILKDKMGNEQFSLLIGLIQKANVILREEN